MAFANVTTAATRDPPIDHFVLALSWSPSFCALPEAADEVLQCTAGRRFAFVVHGLWPQYRNGWPQYCQSSPQWVSDDQIAEMLPLMPSKPLIIQQWRKHGTCSALAIEAYFDLTQELFEKVRIPARYVSPLAPLTTTPQALVSDFLNANRGLAPEMMKVICTSNGRRARLDELRICFAPSGRFTQCRPRSGNNCRAETLMLPPVKARYGRSE
jgi:ribonuclease T2